MNHHIVTRVRLNQFTGEVDEVVLRTLNELPEGRIVVGAEQERRLCAEDVADLLARGDVVHIAAVDGDAGQHLLHERVIVKPGPSRYLQSVDDGGHLSSSLAELPAID